MRTRRMKPEGEGYYHVISRIAGREYLMDAKEKDIFAGMMRRVEKFSGVDVLTFALMDNHFHILVHVPEREKVEEEVLLERYRALYGGARAELLAAKWKSLREAGDGARVEAEQEGLRKRMCDVSEFVKTLKMRYTISYNARKGREGTLWEGRFKSVLVEPDSPALRKVATYIELNAVRAGIVKDPSQYRWCGCGQACRNVRAAVAGIERLVPSSADALREYRSWFGGQAPTSVFPARVERFTKGLALGGRKYVEKVAESAGIAGGRPLFVLCPGEKGEVYALRGPRRVTA